MKHDSFFCVCVLNVALYLNMVAAQIWPLVLLSVTLQSKCPVKHLFYWVCLENLCLLQYETLLYITFVQMFEL